MNVYEVRRRGRTPTNQFSSFIVVALNEAGARQLCALNSKTMANDAETWLDPEKSTVKLVDLGTAQVLSSEYVGI